MKSFYENRIQQFESQFQNWQKKSNQWAFWRIMVAVFSLVLLVYFANERMGWGLTFTLVGAVFLFGWLVKQHNKTKFLRDQQKYIANINEEEVQRLQFNLGNIKDTHVPYDDKHPNATDLDLFGAHSVFKLLNRSAHHYGMNQLSQWLSSPPDTIVEIQKRQKASEELKDDVDWRQNYHALGRHITESKTDISEGLGNLKQMEKGFRVPVWVLPFLGTLFIGSVVGFFFFSTPSSLILLISIIHVFLLRKVFTELKTLGSIADTMNGVFGMYSLMIHEIAKRDFTTSYASAIKERLIDTGHDSRKAMQELGNITDRINARSNFFYGMLDLALLLDFYLLGSVDRWKGKYMEVVSDWFTALGEFDALLSISGYAFSNPGYSFPTLLSDQYTLEATHLGHPLIPNDARVSNNFSMQGKGTIYLITGSNMSGKSTFLRTVGVNMILAYCGAPVCADRMSLSLSMVYTSMRTHDNLEENTSSFFAELKRIRGLIELTQESRLPVMFMLDEILKGTNSADRHRGAEALIKQMIKTESMGFVSTHDIELGVLESEYDSIRNFSFNSFLENDDLVFDYTLTPGVCNSFNAGVLMKKMGIDIKEE